MGNNLYGMNVSEEELRRGYFCVSKMINFIEDESFPELMPEEQAVIHKMFQLEFSEIPNFASTLKFTSEEIFDLLVDETNASLPEILREKIIIRCHDTYHRKEIPIKPYCGIIRTFIQSKDSLKIGKKPISIGQGIVIGKQTILTAKHVLKSSETECNPNEDISQKFSSDMLPDDYRKGEWNLIYLFSLPNSGDHSKDTVFQIIKFDEIPGHPEIDIACAQIEGEINCVVAKLTEVFPKTASVCYMEYDGQYKMYEVKDLELDIGKCLALKSDRHQCTLGPSFMKPGMSGCGVVYNNDDSICGIFNGIVHIRAENQYMPVFRFTPVQQLYGWLKSQIGVDKN